MQPSLTRHLLGWVLGTLVIVSATFTGMGYLTGLHEADELTDGHLASIASLLLADRGGHFAERSNPATLAGQPDLRSHDYQQSMSVIVWDKDGNLVTRTGDAPTPAFSATAEGFQTMDLGTPAKPWRAFSRWDGDDHQRKVMVLLSLEERDGLAADIAEQVAQPGLWLLPAVALLLGLAVHRGLRPLHLLSKEVHELDIHRPQPLSPRHSQREFRAMVDSINTLASRYQAALSRERELANEFAHELRTPLASIALQARVASETMSEADRAQALAQLQRDALRAGDVLNDLLALARASRTELAEAAQSVDVAELAREVLAEYGATALSSGHELAFEGDQTFQVSGHPALLGSALRNLVENALAHTPRGTHVLVRVDAEQRSLEVSDDAAFAAPKAAGSASGTASSFGLGLGLGHRVVEKIASIHGARFERLEPSTPGSHYRLQFPVG